MNCLFYLPAALQLYDWNQQQMCCQNWLTWNRWGYHYSVGNNKQCRRQILLLSTATTSIYWSIRLKYTMPGLPFHLERSPDGATRNVAVGDTQLHLTTHLSTPKGWKAELAWLADLWRTVYPHKWWSPVSYKSRAVQGKFAVINFSMLIFFI